MKYTFVLIIIGSLLMSCYSDPQDQKETGATYLNSPIDLDSLFIQIRSDSLVLKTARKTVTVNGENETRFFPEDYGELYDDIQELNISDLLGQSEYSIERDRSNIIFKKGKYIKNGISVLRILRNERLVIQEIQAEYQDQNWLFNYQKAYVLLFDEDGRLRNYRIQGDKEITFWGSTEFVINVSFG